MIYDSPCVILALTEVSEEAVVGTILAVTFTGGAVTAEFSAIGCRFSLKLAEVADISFAVGLLVCASGTIELVDVFAGSVGCVTAILTFFGIGGSIWIADILEHFIFAGWLKCRGIAGL